MKLLGTLYFNVAVDVGYFIGFNIEVFRWILGHSDGVFVQSEVVSR